MSATSRIIPYRKQQPIVTANLRHGYNSVVVNALLDSGATRSLFSRTEANLLGLDWSQGRAETFLTANGTSFVAYEFVVDLEIEDLRFPARVCFTDSIGMDASLIGRLDVFDKFRIEFCEAEKWLKLTPYSNAWKIF